MIQADNKKQNNDHELLIKLLQDKYEGAKAESLTAIYAENPDYAGRIKAMGRKSRELFGTTLALYLKQIGVIGLKKKTAKASDAEIDAELRAESHVEIAAEIRPENRSENEIVSENRAETETENGSVSRTDTAENAETDNSTSTVADTVTESGAADSSGIEAEAKPEVNPEDKVELETKRFDEVTKSVEKIVPKGDEEPEKKVEPEDERKAEEEFRRRAEEEKKAEELRKLEEERRLEEERKAEELRLEEERKAEEARRAEEERIAEAQRKIEEAYKRFETEHTIWEEHCLKCLEEREEVFQKRCSDRKTELEDEAANRRDDSIKAATEIMIMYQKQLIEAQNILDSLGLFKFGEKKAQKAIIAKAEEKIANAKHDIEAAKELYYSELPIIDFKIRLAEEQMRLDVENDIPMPIEPVLKLDTEEEPAV
ncbi:MAG: hypothetical protein K5795_07665 [Lachnospiraceae bacterium]|nr:hypothetical protein [Lachnospiraceae bacterium]